MINLNKQGQQIKNKFIFAAIISLTLLIISSCYTPSPLYGKWQTFDGTKTITFIQGGSWIGNLRGSTEEGEWATYDNVLVISFDGFSFASEWDLRGGVLKLTWVDEYNAPINYSLFHAGK